jgi:WD40 repeat protein
MGSIVFLHDLRRGVLVRTKRLPSRVLTPLALSGDCKQRLSAGLDRTLRLIPLDTNEEPRALAEMHETPVRCLAVSPDGRHALTGAGGPRLQDDKPVRGADGTARRWGCPSGKLLETFIRSSGAIRADRFTRRDRCVLAVGEADHSSFWTTDDDGDAAPLYYPDGVKAACGDVSPDGKYAVLGGADFASDGLTLATRSKDRTERIWSLALRQLDKIDVKEEVAGLASVPDGKRVATCGKDIRLWDVDVKKP